MFSNTFTHNSRTFTIIKNQTDLGFDYTLFDDQDKKISKISTTKEMYYDALEFATFDIEQEIINFFVNEVKRYF
jgi:hypothetical protein